MIRKGFENDKPFEYYVIFQVGNKGGLRNPKTTNVMQIGLTFIH